MLQKQDRGINVCFKNVDYYTLYIMLLYYDIAYNCKLYSFNRLRS